MSERTITVGAMVDAAPAGRSLVILIICRGGRVVSRPDNGMGAANPNTDPSIWVRMSSRPRVVN